MSEQPDSQQPEGLRFIIVLEITVTHPEQMYNASRSISALGIPGLAPSALIAVDPAAQHVLDYLSAPERQREIPYGSVYGLDEDDLKDIIEHEPKEI